jgi:hypothetical protein
MGAEIAAALGGSGRGGSLSEMIAQIAAQNEAQAPQAGNIRGGAQPVDTGSTVQAAQPVQATQPSGDPQIDKLSSRMDAMEAGQSSGATSMGGAPQTNFNPPPMSNQSGTARPVFTEGDMKVANNIFGSMQGRQSAVGAIDPSIQEIV